MYNFHDGKKPKLDRIKEILKISIDISFFVRNLLQFKNEITLCKWGTPYEKKNCRDS
jgi:hypothetical protein